MDRQGTCLVSLTDFSFMIAEEARYVPLHLGGMEDSDVERNYANISHQILI